MKDSRYSENIVINSLGKVRHKALRWKASLNNTIYRQLGITVGYVLGLIAIGQANPFENNDETQLVLVVTDLHLVQNLCAREAANKKVTQIFFYALTSKDKLKIIAANHGINGNTISFIRIVSELIISLREKRKTSILVPLIADYLTGLSTFNLLTTLLKFGLVKFYDDGMATVSSKNRNIKRKTLPKNTIVYSWNYMYIGNRYSEPLNIVRRSSLIQSKKILKTFYKNDYDWIEKHLSWKAPSQLEYTIILASKGLGSSLGNILPNEEHRYCYYIPHYQKWKNSPDMLKKCNILRLNSPEAFLLGILDAEKKCLITIVFGITSTALYILDAFLNNRSSQLDCNLQWLFYCEPSTLEEDDQGEYLDFRDCISYYQKKISNLNILTK